MLSTLLKYIIDPTGQFYKVDKQRIQRELDSMTDIVRIAAIEGQGENGIVLEKKLLEYDEYLEAFIKGTNGYLSTYNAEKNSNSPLLIRGLSKNSQLAIKECWKTDREFYAIDSGYIGNETSKSKIWHRITKNALQNTGPIISRPTDRLALTNTHPCAMYSGSKILICPPSDKVMRMYNQSSAEEWTNDIINKLKNLTDRPIEIRLKPQRQHRISSNSIQQAFTEDVYCLITYNSIAALEALVNGKPAIALGQNCATTLCNTELEDIENLNYPTLDEVVALLAHLSYCQFTKQEMMNGYAWKILNEGS